MINKHEKSNHKVKALIGILVITNVISLVIIYVLFGQINMLQEKLLEILEIMRVLELRIDKIKLLQNQFLKIDRVNKSYLLAGMFIGKVIFAKLRVFK